MRSLLRITELKKRGFNDFPFAVDFHGYGLGQPILVANQAANAVERASSSIGIARSGKYTLVARL